MVTRTVSRTVPRPAARKSAQPNVLQAVREVLLWSESRTTQEPRSLFTIAFAPAGVLLGLVAAIALVALVSVDSDLSGAFGAVAVAWLAVHQVPVSIADISLGALPLVPTAILFGLVARLASQAATTRPAWRERRQVLAAAVAGPLVITMILLAVAKDASTVVPLGAPAPALALAWVTGVHLAGAALGVTWSTREELAGSLSIPDWGRAALKTGIRAGLWLVVLGAGLVVVSMVLGWSRLGVGFDSETGVVGLVGVLLVSVLYLPNVAVGGMDVLLGATVQLGPTSVSLVHARLGQLPALPVFTSLASWHAQPWHLVGLAAAAAVGLWLGAQCHAEVVGGLGSRSAVTALRAVVCAAAVASALIVVVSAGACGRVGVIGRWSVNLPLLGLATFGLLAVPGAVVAATASAKTALRTPRGAQAVVVISPGRAEPASVWSEPGEDRAEEPEDAEDKSEPEPVEAGPEVGEADRDE